MAIVNFGIILLLCFSNLEYSFGKPIQGGPKLDNLDPEFKDPIDSAIQNDEGQNRIDVLKNYIVNQTGENYQEIQNACLHKNVSTSILPPTSTTTTEKGTSFL